MSLPDSCLNCGDEDHLEDTCPEFTTLQSYEDFMAEHGLNPDDDINLIL